MTLRVADISSYLDATGWHRTPETWRGAVIWSAGQTEVLVPPTDDLGDADLRIRELLAGLATVEARDPADIARDIGSPFADTTTFRTGPLPLAEGADVVAGLHRMVLTAARIVVEGPRRSFVGRPPAKVSGLLGSTGLATGHIPGFSVSLSLDVASDIGRDVAIQLFDATSAVQESIEQPDDAALDGVAAAGVSAGFALPWAISARTPSSSTSGERTACAPVCPPGRWRATAPLPPRPPGCSTSLTIEEAPPPRVRRAHGGGGAPAGESGVGVAPRSPRSCGRPVAAAPTAAGPGRCGGRSRSTASCRRAIATDPLDEFHGR